MKRKQLTSNGPPMIYRATVLKRPGWTLAALKKFAPEPDKRVPNPWYKSSPPCELYFRWRIEKIEETAEFRAWRKTATKRKKAAKQAAETKREMMLSWARDLKIDFARRDLAQVRKEARIDHAWRAYEHNRDEIDYKHQEFLDRIAVNYLRHQESRYHALLDSTWGKVAASEAYPIIKRKVLRAIATAYPELAEECARQESGISS